MLSAKNIVSDTGLPVEVRKEFRNMVPPESPERELFQAIIMRAVMDALGHTNLEPGDHHELAVGEARRWFKFGENVHEYCELAGLGPNLRNIVLRSMKERDIR